jgi:heme oxygenase
LSAREFLKSNTALLHRQVEDQTDWMRDGFALYDYKNLLSKLLSFYEGVEKDLNSRKDLPENLEWELRQKTKLLKNDLHALNLTSSEIITNRHLPPMRTLAEVFGVLYVLEGSTMGGQMLAKHFIKKLGIDANSGGSFFSAYGRETMPMWKKFIYSLDSHVITQLEKDEALNSAKKTFLNLGTWTTT